MSKLNKDYTHISMVIDRSGSMYSNWADVVGGYKQIVQDQKAEKGKCTFTVAAFDNEYVIVEDFTDIQKVDETLKVTPRGSTALLDAIGRTINSVGEKLAAIKEKDRPAKVIMMVQTDGFENASKEFTKAQIKELVEKQTKDYNWQFMFIGASLDAVNDASNYGFMKCNSSTYDTSNYSATLNTLSEKMTCMRGLAPEMVAMAAAFTEEERETINTVK